MLSSPSVGELCRWIVRSRELTPFSTIIPILNSPSRQHALPPIYSVVSSSSCPPSLTGTGYTFETDNRDNRIVTFTSQIIGFEFSHTYLASKGRHSDVLHFLVVIMLMQKAITHVSSRKWTKKISTILISKSGTLEWYIVITPINLFFVFSLSQGLGMLHKTHLHKVILFCIRNLSGSYSFVPSVLLSVFISCPLLFKQLDLHKCVGVVFYSLLQYQNVQAKCPF